MRVRTSSRPGAVLLTLVLLLGSAGGWALDFTLHSAVDALVPGDASSYSTGFGAEFSANLGLFNFLTPFVEGGIGVTPILNSSKSLMFFNGGGGLGVYAYPVPRIKLSAAVSGGLYLGSFDGSSRTDYYWKGSLGAGYRLSPSFSLLVNASYINYLQYYEPWVSSLGLGILADINLGKRGAGVKVLGAPKDSFFPVEYETYSTRSIGSVTITNTEQAEIRNVKVSFFVGDYSSESIVCATIPYMAKGASAEVPLYAILGNNILGITETTKVQGSLKIGYELLGAAQSLTRAEPVTILHRNALTWADPSLVAAFISPSDPSVLDLSKFAVGLIREKLRPDLDKNLQFGMGLFESLRLLGLKYAPDPSTPYASFHRDPSKIDYLQYPYQTLAYKGGDSDELGVLFATTLVSIDVPAALVLLDDDVVVAFKLAIGEAQARAEFLKPNELIYRNGAVWLPLQMSKLREGFLSAWASGSTSWQKAVAQGAPTFIDLAQAWQTHKDVGLAGLEFKPYKPTEAALSLAFENLMGRFVAKELEPRAEKLLADMGQAGTGRQYNSLGVLYARYGLLQKAREAFLKASQLDFAPALTNVANVAYLQKDYEVAITFFEAALKLNPENMIATIGLAKAKYEIDAYAEADSLYSRVVSADPGLAARYAYLSSKVDASTSRASSAAADRGGATEWDLEP